MSMPHETTFKHRLHLLGCIFVGCATLAWMFPLGSGARASGVAFVFVAFAFGYATMRVIAAVFVDSFLGSFIDRKLIRGWAIILFYGTIPGAALMLIFGALRVGESFGEPAFLAYAIAGASGISAAAVRLLRSTESSNTPSQPIARKDARSG